ncbi:MAG: hypothetical protein AAF495_14705 [Pseudomonadota bacterium]
MRFLLFNVVVIGALVYLFAIERDGPSMTVSQFQEELQEIETLAAEALEPVVQAAPPAPTPEADPVEVEPVAAQPEPEPDPEDWLVELPPVDNPAVAQRRREVLDGLDGPADAAPVVAAAPVAAETEVVLAEGESLMSPSERVKQLHVLAEEMELLFVQSLSE